MERNELSILLKARPDSFIPATDIIAADQYVIYMDVPGISEEEIEMYR
jgi:HSP20 family molecular chaperone IbpA